MKRDNRKPEIPRSQESSARQTQHQENYIGQRKDSLKQPVVMKWNPT